MKHLFIAVLIFSFLGCSSNMNSQAPTAYSDDHTNHYGASMEKEKDRNEVKTTKENPAKKKKDIIQNQEKKMLNVPLIKQNPELKYGCEVTSLTMVLKYAGFKVNKVQLANQMPKDYDYLVKSKTGDIKKWGDPNEGFVGDVTGKSAGYAVFDKPLEKLMKKYLGSRTINLTGEAFPMFLGQIDKGKPVIVWTTGDYRLPDRWESWYHGNEKITTPLDLHAVVLVGYDKNNIYLNDPLSGVKGQRVSKKIFIGSWKALKKRGLSYN